jgi:hypothetical protein
MSLTKKHFLKIAEIVSRLTCLEKTKLQGISIAFLNKNELVIELSKFFKEENANFKADKFKEACYKN